MAETNDNIITPEPEATPAEPTQAPEKMVRTWGMLCHLAALAGFIGIPFGNIVGPLGGWLIKKEEHPFIDEQGKASLNFQVSMAIYAIIPFFLVFVVIGIPLLFALGIFDLIFVIIASVKASNGESQKYPLSIRFFK